MKLGVVQEEDSARMQGQSLCLGAGIVPARVQVESLVGPGQGPVWSRVKHLVGRGSKWSGGPLLWTDRSGAETRLIGSRMKCRAWLRAERLSPSRVTTLAQ